MNKIWETNGVFGGIDTQARIIDLEGDKVLEIIVPKDRLSLLGRLKVAFRYIFGGSSLGFGSFYLKDSDVESLSALGDSVNDRKDY